MAAAAFTVISILALYYCISLTSANNLLHCGNCLCPEGVLVFSCHVNGGVATVWKGNIFNCSGNGNEITLRHSVFNDRISKRTGSCNDGNIVAYNIDLTNNIYSSQLNIAISPEMHNGTVECIQYRGRNSTYVIVGGYTLILHATGIVISTI